MLDRITWNYEEYISANEALLLRGSWQEDLSPDSKKLALYVLAIGYYVKVKISLASYTNII